MRKDIDAAFRATTYRVFVPDEPPIDIRIGERSPRLDAILAAYECNAWAFITAWNPGSQPLPRDENAARQMDLLALVDARGYRRLMGSGVPAGADWQAEESVLVLGVPKAEAIELGARFDQLAVVIGARGGAAELAYCT
jgi:hypothetical protein